MVIYLGNVTKRKNSTFVPSLNQNPIEVYLKDGTSDTAPTFLLSSTERIDANYLRWDNRYYFIEDIVIEKNNLYNLKCVLDVLATYKSYILSTTAFVAYDTTENTEIVDSRLSMETTKQWSDNAQRLNYIGEGFFIAVAVTGESSCQVFALSLWQANDLLNTINNWLDRADVLPYPEIGSLSDLVEAIETLCYNLVASARQLISTGKATDSIKSATIIPLSIDRIGGGESEIYLGKFSTEVYAKTLEPYDIIVESANLSVPWLADDWRRNAPFHEIFLELPFIGAITISPSDLIPLHDYDNVSVTYYFSAMNGDLIVRVKAGNVLINEFHTNLSCPYLIGASNVSAMQTATTLASGIGATAAAIATSGASAVVAGTAGIVGVTNNIQATPTSIGTGSGGAIYGVGETSFPNYIRINVIYHDTNVEPDSVTPAIGTPTMAVKSLSGLTGYCECRNASVSAPAESRILDEINAYLNSGFFIE